MGNIDKLARTDAFESLVRHAIIVSGPTASGKSSLAMALAEAVDGEIISLDAIAVYQTMDIGSAKPSVSQRQQIRHHLIDVVTPEVDFSVAVYLSMAHAAIDDIRGRGKVPIIAGGTPMYLRAVLRGFDAGPPADQEFRDAVMADVETFGTDELRRRLYQVDPLSAHRIDAGDVRRMVRALEVSYLTGKPISHRQTQHHRARDPSATTAFWLAWPRPILHQRINQRTGEMFAQGLVEETRQMIQRYRLSKTAAAAVGYREVIEMLSQSDSPDQEAIAACRESVATHTRQLARRQETWLRSFDEVVALPGDQSSDEQVDSIVRRWRTTRQRN